MARIGVFGLNMSARSGGVHSLIEGLMSHAGESRHEFLYVTQRRRGSVAWPDNVEVLTCSAMARIATQCMLNVPRVGVLLGSQAAAAGLLGLAGQLSPRVFRDVDAWLWPHCFMPVPRLGRTVVICHDLIHRRHPEYFSRRDRARRKQAERSLGRCAAILCPSATTAEDLVEAYPALSGRVHLFAEAPCQTVAVEQCRQEQAQLEATYGEMPLFLFVGVDWPHKNHRLLIEAAAALRRRTARPFKVVFAGHRRTGAVGAAIREMGMQEMVIDAGTVSRPMLGALYRRAIAFVFPSRSEGFGIPLVEAMQYGLPIIASECPCIPEVCGGGAILLPPDAPELWAEQMLRVMSEPEHRAELAGLASRRASEFTWQRTWREVDNAFAAALADGSRGTGGTVGVAGHSWRKSA